MRLQRVWLIYRADSPLALKEARRCADELESIGVTCILAMSGLTADPFPGLLASEPRLPDLAVVLGGDGTYCLCRECAWLNLCKLLTNQS